jgi:hypothetical protein
LFPLHVQICHIGVGYCVALNGINVFKLNCNQLFFKRNKIKDIVTEINCVMEERKVAAEGAQTEGAQTEGAQIEKMLLAIINEGNDAFKREHGRNMSYAEMRGMYG